MNIKNHKFLIKIIILFLFSTFFFCLYKNSIYFIFSNCKLKTISFQRSFTKFDMKYTSIFSNNSYYNLTFFYDMSEDPFRVEKLKALGFKSNMNIGIYNLYILPYIMQENLEYIISKL